MLFLVSWNNVRFHLSLDFNFKKKRIDFHNKSHKKSAHFLKLCVRIYMYILNYGATGMRTDWCRLYFGLFLPSSLKRYDGEFFMILPQRWKCLFGRTGTFILFRCFVILSIFSLILSFNPSIKQYRKLMS